MLTRCTEILVDIDTQAWTVWTQFQCHLSWDFKERLQNVYKCNVVPGDR
jgi:hypothetical protein